MAYHSIAMFDQPRPGVMPWVVENKNAGAGVEERTGRWMNFIFAHKLGVATLLILSTWGVLLAELSQVDGQPMSYVVQRVAEHGILAMLVAALMWMGWLRENRLATEQTNRETAMNAYFNERLKLASEMIESRDGFIRDHLMQLIERTHENIASCHHFRGNAMVTLEELRQSAGSIIKKEG